MSRVRQRFERLGPNATWWLVYVAVGVALNMADALFRWLTWDRPPWLNFLAGLTYALFACVAASHWKQIAADRARSNAGEPS